MVETRSPDPEEAMAGEAEAAAAAEEKAVQRAKKRAVAARKAALPQTISKKKKQGALAWAGVVAEKEERQAQQRKRAAQQERTKGDEEYQRSVRGFLDGPLSRKKGKLFVPEQVTDGLHVFYALQSKFGVPRRNAFGKTATLLGRSEGSVREHVKSFEEGGKIIVKDGAGRGGTDRSSLLPDTQRRIDLWVEEKHSVGAPVYAKDLHRWLESDPPAGAAGGEDGDGSGEGQSGNVKEYDQDRCAIEVSENTVRNWLVKMGYKRREGRAGYTVSDDRRAGKGA